MWKRFSGSVPELPSGREGRTYSLLKARMPAVWKNRQWSHADPLAVNG
jgi:hypothetical protein